MQFDPQNPIVQLCAKGMDYEGQGKKEEAFLCFEQAWNKAQNDMEKLIAAHYMARQQNSIGDKLKWDKISLALALNIRDENAKGMYPSLYLNVGKCYEDLGDAEQALENYKTGLAHTDSLEKDGYGKMIRGGLLDGIQRIHSGLKDDNS